MIPSVHLRGEQLDEPEAAHNEHLMREGTSAGRVIATT